MRVNRSKRLFRRARQVLPGGVNSPVRAFGSVGGTPRFIARASGSSVEDVDGNRYVDFVASWGAVIAGHAHPVIVEAVRRAAANGTSFGAPTEAEIELAERVAACVPSIEMLRLVNSGTEAAMSALRLARAATGRDKILKFEGCYHGHADAVLAAAGSGVATLGIPGSVGVPAAAVADTLVVPFNDLSAVEATFTARPDEIAAVVVEPIPANMGLVWPDPDFLTGLRDSCDAFGSLLVFDEVISGFRVGLGGAQERFGVTPDLTCLGKVIGGGLPVGAYGGRARLMERIAPAGDVYQAGTLAGNPLAVAAGLAALELITPPGVFDAFEARSSRVAKELEAAALEVGLPFQTRAAGALFGVAFSETPVRTYADAAAADHDRYGRFFHAMLDQGIYLAPSGYEAGFLTLAHGDAEIDQLLQAARRAFKKVA